MIGTSSYSSDALPNLPAVSRNLEALRAILIDPCLGGLPPDHVAVIHNSPDDAEISEEILRRAELAEDTLLVYVAGHGLPGLRTGKLYLALYNTNPDQAPFRTLRYDELRDVVMDRGRIAAANRVVILDCCFSGRAIPTMSAGAITGLTEIEGVYVLTATAPNHVALSPPDAEFTAFTGALLELLRNGVPGGPALLTLTTLYEGVLQKMRARGHPRPEQINKDTVAQLAISRNAAFAATTRAVPVVPIIKIVGAGGGGVNTVARMIESGIAGVEYVAINTDTTSFPLIDADTKVSIGGKLTGGMGARFDPAVGRRAAEEDASEIERALSGADLVFVTCGEGGGTGTGGTPVVAEIARRLGALTVGVVTLPFTFEGRRRQAQAEAGITELRKHCDTVIVVANDGLVSGGSVSLLDAFRAADEVLVRAVRGIVHLLTTPGAIRIGFDAVRGALDDAGPAVIGLGRGRGTDRVMAAAQEAIAGQRTITDQAIDGARVVLLTIAGASDITHEEVSATAAMVSELVHPDADIVFGVAFDDTFGEEVQVVVIAARFDGRFGVRSPVRQ